MKKCLKNIQFILIGTILSVACLFLPITVHAETEKTLSIPFMKDYREANFTFEFEDEQMHHITITGPNGSVTTKDSDALTVIVKVPNAISGTYEISIKAEEEITVKSNVECITAAVSEVTQDISVTSVISGLEMYFSDGNLRLKWDDTGLGKINVRVTNPSSMQVLGEETVTDNTFSLNLAQNVEEVEIFVVPASEARIDGAGITYTIPVIRDIDASIVPPDINLTNIETVTFNASFGRDIEVVITENGDTVFDETYEAGETEITAPLNGVNNDIVVTLIDIQTNNRVTYEFSITKDMIAPTLSFDKSYNNTETQANKIVITGIMKGGNFLYVNNQEVEYESSGNFEVEVPLSIGENTIAVCGVDNAGNEFPVIFKVTRLEQKQNYTIYYLILAGLLIIVVLFVAVIFKVKKMKNEEKAKEKENKDENKVENIEVGTRKKEKKVDESVKTSDDLQKKIEEIKAVRKRDFFLFKLAPIFIVGITIILINTVFFQIAIIPSESMVPNVRVGEIVFFNKLAYIKNSPQRGDIIYFDGNSYSEKSYLCKRVIGIPGDKIEFINGDVYINDKKVNEGYISEEIETNSNNVFEVPANCVFAMGDNRENSLDSRFFTNPYISYDDIKGKYAGGFYNEFIASIIAK